MELTDIFRRTDRVVLELLMQARWRLAENRAYRAVYRGCPHGFELLTPAGQESAAYFGLAQSFIAACLGDNV